LEALDQNIRRVAMQPIRRARHTVAVEAQEGGQDRDRFGSR
jgi:hypothetical protein